MVDVAFVALGLAALALMGLYALALRQLQPHPMSEPILGLVVAVGLGLYLLYTLAHPEKSSIRLLRRTPEDWLVFIVLV